jgi:hypothetical protein
MQQDFRALTKRHMRLSWLWGMYAVWAVGLLGAAISFVFYNRCIQSLTVPTVAYYALIGFVGTMLGLGLGLPALLGELMRQRVMQKTFTSTTSLSRLILCTAGLFEVSVAFSLLLYLMLFFVIGPKADFEMTITQFVAFTAKLFFVLSMPWLLSSVAAAWWLGRGLFPR